jgi:hypothetical protein
MMRRFTYLHGCLGPEAGVHQQREYGPNETSKTTGSGGSRAMLYQSPSRYRDGLGLQLA